MTWNTMESLSLFFSITFKSLESPSQVSRAPPDLFDPGYVVWGTLSLGTSLLDHLRLVEGPLHFRLQ